MKKQLLLSLSLLLFSLNLFSQTSRIDISGTVSDTLGSPLSFSSVLLLTPTDSALVSYTLSDDEGRFSFKNANRQNYLVKATYVGHLPYQELLMPTTEKEQNLGIIRLTAISKELYEVVVKTARAPISIKGDTIEYDASKFIVPPGSSVEDLLRKLPGVEVQQDGTIKAQGEDVQKVTVDGRRFFGGDTKMATKNLAADAIKKVQIFDDKSEQAKLTGVDDGKKEKTVNLELKDEAKKGGFGKVTAGTGTDSRSTASGNYNKFDKKNQFSIIGFGNNTNQTGMSWDDYQDFRGSNAFNWGDDGDFGFNGNSGMRYITFDDNDDSFSIPIGGRNGDGFSTNAAGGLNYNYKEKKDDLSASYFYNQSRQILDAFQNRQNFISNTQSNFTTDQSNQLNFSGNHRMSLRGQKELDSLNTLTFIGNGRLGKRETTYDSFQEIFRSADDLANQSTIENNSNRLSYAASSTLLYRHKFKKRGRNFALSGAYNLSNYDTEAIQKSKNEFFNATDMSSFIQSINQLNNTLGSSNEIKSSLLFIEPFAKNFSWESFYNFSLSNSEVDRAVTDKFLDKPDEINPNLSRLYSNQILYNRVGTSVRYSNKGFNLTSGLADVNFAIDGNLVGSFINAGESLVTKKYNALTPYSAFSYRMRNNKSVYLEYNKNIRAPSTNDLQPIVDNSNPLYIREGNPDLLPQISHELSARFNSYNPVSFVNLFMNVRYSYNVNQIIYNQRIDPELFITTTKPVNITGGENISSYVYFGFPLKKTKATANVNASLNYGTNLSYINDVLNETNSKNYNLGVRLNLTPMDWFTLYSYSNWGFGKTSYSINTNQNFNILNTTHNVEMSIKFPKNIFWSTNFNYQLYENKNFGFDQKIPILNMSAYKLLGAKKKAEIRLSAYDIFKRNLGISQYASQNFVSSRQVQTLSRYFILSFTYNMRGVSDSILQR